MMKRIVTTALFLAVCGGAAQAAQESHGGNSHSLRFVKMGRVVEKILSRTGLLNDVTGPGVVSWSLDNSFVSVSKNIETHSGEVFANAGEHFYINSPFIYVNRDYWSSLSCRYQIREVLHVYLKDLYLTGRAPLAKDDAYRLSGRILKYLGSESSCSALIAGPRAHSAGTSSLKHEIFQLSLELKSILASSNKNIWREISKELEKIPISFEKIPLGDSLYPQSNPLLRDKVVVTLGVDPKIADANQTFSLYSIFADVDAYTRAIEEKYRHKYLLKSKPQGVKMMVDGLLWRNLLPEEKLEILLHENIGLISSADLYYRISSLFFWINE